MPHRFNGTAHLIARKVFVHPSPNVPSGLLQWDRAFDRAEGLANQSAGLQLGLLQWDRAFDRAEGRGVRIIRRTA